MGLHASRCTARHEGDLGRISQELLLEARGESMSQSFLLKARRMKEDAQRKAVKFDGKKQCRCSSHSQVRAKEMKEYNDWAGFENKTGMYVSAGDEANERREERELVTGEQR